jgi:hypothetical protein
MFEGRSTESNSQVRTCAPADADPSKVILNNSRSSGQPCGGCGDTDEVACGVHHVGIAGETAGAALIRTVAGRHVGGRIHQQPILARRIAWRTAAAPAVERGDLHRTVMPKNRRG